MPLFFLCIFVFFVAICCLRSVCVYSLRFQETILGIYAFGLGTATILMLTLLIVRAIGYRLISPADKRLESPAGPSGR